MRKRRYTPEQKQEAIELLGISGKSIAQVVMDLDISESTLWNWINRVRIDTGEDQPEASATSERVLAYRSVFTIRGAVSHSVAPPIFEIQ